MRQDRFVVLNEPGWRECEALIEHARGRPRHRGGAGTSGLPAGGLASFPRRYRQVAQHLALARARGYSVGLVERLERLTIDGHQVLYERRRPVAAGLVDLVARGFPRRLRRAWASVLVSTVLFLGSMVAAAVAVVVEPDAIFAVLDHEQLASIEAMYDPASERLGRTRDAGDDLAMFGFYLRNNTGIGFQTFASGLLGGLGTGAFLLFNGTHIGAVAAHLSTNGFAAPFWSFVAGHSAFELTAIVVCGAAGLRLGWGLVRPGNRTRAGSLVASGREVIVLVYGAALLFLLAAFVEAFWSPSTAVPAGVKYASGVLLWVATVSYLVLAGRDRAR